MKKYKDQQKGVSLLMAMLLVVIITAVISGVTLRTTFNIKRSAVLNYLDYAEVYQKIALNYGLSLLVRDSNQSNYDAKDESWALVTPAYTIEGGQVSGYINELSSQFNLARLQGGDAFSQLVFQKLLQELGFNTQDGEKIISAVQSRQYYSAIGILVAAGFDQPKMNGLIHYVSYLPIDSELLNINFVSPEVFAAYLDLSVSRAAEILNNLQNDPIKSKEALNTFAIENNLNTTYITDNEGNETGQGVIESVFGVSSRFFQIVSLVEVGQSESTQLTEVDRTGHVVRILNQRVNKLANE